MVIPASDWDAYVRKLSAINNRAAKLMQDFIDRNGYGDAQRLIDYAFSLTQKYGDAASALTCEMYEAIAAAQGVAVTAEAVSSRDVNYIAASVNNLLDSSPASIAALVGRLVKEAGADTMLRNAERDGAEFAWIPRGDTCPFCITLASRGWQHVSKRSLKNGHAEHIHSNCDCTYAVRFDGKSDVAGYDPQKYRDMYYGADGSTPKERINAMRREQYAGNKDAINERKRIAYSQKKITERLANESESAILYIDKQIAVYSEKPELLGKTTPQEKYDIFVANGADVKPLGFGKLKGIPFGEGGGFRVIGRKDGGYLQYHPDNGSHHNGAYYKISLGKSGTVRYNLDGTLLSDKGG